MKTIDKIKKDIKEKGTILDWYEFNRLREEEEDEMDDPNNKWK